MDDDARWIRNRLEAQVRKQKVVIMQANETIALLRLELAQLRQNIRVQEAALKVRHG